LTKDGKSSNAFQSQSGPYYIAIKKVKMNSFNVSQASQNE
jgi:hypothetical protein